MEVTTPPKESPDEGSIAIEFYMPPICSPLVRPGRPAEEVPFVSKQLSDAILSSGMINLKELSLVSGKSAWMAYLDVYCLDAYGSLLEAALLAVVAAFSDLRIPVVSLERIKGNNRTTYLTRHHNAFWVDFDDFQFMRIEPEVVRYVSGSAMALGIRRVY